MVLHTLSLSIWEAEAVDPYEYEYQASQDSTVKSYLSNSVGGTREMSQQLRALVGPAEDQNSVPKTHMAAPNQM